MSKTKKSWREKLTDDKGLPRVHKVVRKRTIWGLKAGDTMLIPAPSEVDAFMKRVPPGKLVTTNELRAALARKHRATLACPMATGIFAWIAAHAAEESRHAGETEITPYWRTLKIKGEVNAKFPGGVAACARRLRAEGHKIVKKGERRFVADFERSLADLP